MLISKLAEFTSFDNSVVLLPTFNKPNLNNLQILLQVYINQ
jgi:hypothetical protein